MPSVSSLATGKPDQKEQIKNENPEDEVIVEIGGPSVTEEETVEEQVLVPDEIIDFYNQVQEVLEKDEYDVFKTKAKRKLTQQVSRTNVQLEKLVTLRLRSHNATKAVASKLKEVLDKNLVSKNSLIAELKLDEDI